MPAIKPLAVIFASLLLGMIVSTFMPGCQPVAAPPQPVLKGTDIPTSIDGRTVVLVDDVLYTGRTVRAALDELIDFGRPARIELAVLVDRGHRELPIHADYAGKTLTTTREEVVQVRLKEEDGDDRVVLLERGAPPPARRPARKRRPRR